MTIARRFNAGSLIRRCRSPEGTAECPYVLRQLRNQREHHRRVIFQEEFLALLKKHRIEYDERYMWD
jgi:hypothetical protein